jgi:hypothetical protein
LRILRQLTHRLRLWFLVCSGWQCPWNNDIYLWNHTVSNPRRLQCYISNSSQQVCIEPLNTHTHTHTQTHIILCVCICFSNLVTFCIEPDEVRKICLQTLVLMKVWHGWLAKDFSLFIHHESPQSCTSLCNIIKYNSYMQHRKISISGAGAADTGIPENFLLQVRGNDSHNTTATEVGLYETIFINILFKVKKEWDFSSSTGQGSFDYIITWEYETPVLPTSLYFVTSIEEVLSPCLYFRFIFIVTHQEDFTMA